MDSRKKFSKGKRKSGEEGAGVGVDAQRPNSESLARRIASSSSVKVWMMLKVIGEESVSKKSARAEENEGTYTTGPNTSFLLISLSSGTFEKMVGWM